MSKYDLVLEVLLQPIIYRMEKIMATVEELQQQLQQAKDSLQGAIQRVEDDVENLKSQLGDRIDPSDLDPISQGLADLKAATDALDPDPSNPPTEPQ